MQKPEKVITILFFLISVTSFSQEWKHLREYKKTTGNKVLKNGNWLKKDRKKNTKTWQKANKFNLTKDNGNLKYKSISQIRDFYFWFDKERKNLDHEIITVGVLAIVAKQLSNFDNYFIRTFIVRNKEVIWFANEGSKNVLAYAFPLLKKLYFSKTPLKSEAAKKWDISYMKTEQCKIVEPIYNRLSEKGILKLTRIAKGKGIYNLGVKNNIKFEGNIKNCKERYEHAFLKLTPYYLRKK